MIASKLSLHKLSKKGKIIKVGVDCSTKRLVYLYCTNASVPSFEGTAK